MLSELIFLNAVLSRWLKTPAAPICEISLETRDKRARPYFREEIRAMRSSMKRLSPQSYIRVFYNEGPFVHPPGAWPNPFHPFHMKTLAYVPRQKVAGRAKVRQLRRHQFVIKLDPQ
jgi:hypothetical protein